MTQRKPRELPFDSWIDRQIDDARRDGLFDDLPGRGRPLPNLAEVDDPLWFAKRLAAREGVSLLPPSLELRRKAQALREGLGRLPSERRVREAAEGLNAEIRRHNARSRSGPPTTQAPLDPEELVADWRRARRPAAGEEVPS